MRKNFPVLLNEHGAGAQGVPGGGDAGVVQAVVLPLIALVLQDAIAHELERLGVPAKRLTSEERLLIIAALEESEEGLLILSGRSGASARTAGRIPEPRRAPPLFLNLGQVAVHAGLGAAQARGHILHGSLKQENPALLQGGDDQQPLLGNPGP